MFSEETVHHRLETNFTQSSNGQQNKVASSIHGRHIGKISSCLWGISKAETGTLGLLRYQRSCVVPQYQA